LRDELSSIGHPSIVGSAPTPDSVWRTLLQDETQTQALAEQLARSPLLANAVIALHGDLGAGKTTLVRHLLRALGVAGRIKSPTYTVVEPHEAPWPAAWPSGVAGQLHIWHFDFYRFSDPREWEDAGFRELFAQPGLKLVEWPEKAQGAMPAPDADLILQPMDDHEPSRRFTFMARTPLGQQLLEAVRP
jgi:tRNA threonylcarbamoyladenosine biosynthesis protein TsaE